MTVAECDSLKPGDMIFWRVTGDCYGIITDINVVVGNKLAFRVYWLNEDKRKRWNPLVYKRELSSSSFWHCCE